MNRNIMARSFLIALFLFLFILNIHTPEDQDRIALMNETPQEFVRRICDGMYLTSDTETIDNGVSDFGN